MGGTEADASADLEQLSRYAAALADAIEAALPQWVVRSVARRAAGLESESRAAGERARAEVGPKVRALLATDVDRQWTNPLQLVRGAVTYPTAVLRAAGVPPSARDAFAERVFPEDVYDLSPASFEDVDPALSELGIEWGAAKAHVVLQRRRHR
jgi:hypothetical protein